VSRRLEGFPWVVDVSLLRGSDISGALRLAFHPSVYMQEQRCAAEQARQAAGELELRCGETQQRVTAVESEMRALLVAVQRHKGASAAKMAQLAGLLQVRRLAGLE